MNIAHIVSSYYPAFRYGGTVQSVHLLNKELARQGVNVSVFTTDTGLESKRDIPRNKWVDLDGVKVKYFRFYGYKNYAFSPGLFFSLLQEADKFDIFHITGVWNFSVFAGSVVAGIKKKSYILSPQGIINPEAMRIHSYRQKKFMYHLFAKHCLKGASALCFTSKDEQMRVFNYFRFNNPSFVVPNGVDLHEFSGLLNTGCFSDQYPRFSGRKYILFLGRINIIKGLDILIDSFKRIAAELPEVDLVIAGPDNEGYGAEVKKAIKKCNLNNRVLFTGMLYGQQKLAAYAGANIFVLPSYSENFGMSVVEAMTAGVPVVVSNKVGISDEIEARQAGIVVDTNADSLYNGLKRLLGDEELGKRISQQAKNMVRELYDIRDVSREMIKMYESIIKRKKSALVDK